MRRNPAALVAGLVGVLLGGAAVLAFGGSSDGGSAGRPRFPATDSVDAGFARDMATHHAQAIDLAERIRFRTEDDTVRGVATDIALGQALQIGQMQGWLDVWGLPRGTAAPAMAWMGMGGQPMPGMASNAELAEVGTLPLAQAEVRFLELMIQHHRGGVAMAEFAAQRATTEQARRLATSIVEAQTVEIELLGGLLRERGVVPPDPRLESSVGGPSESGPPASTAMSGHTHTTG